MSQDTELELGSETTTTEEVEKKSGDSSAQDEETLSETSTDITDDEDVDTLKEKLAKAEKKVFEKRKIAEYYKIKNTKSKSDPIILENVKTVARLAAKYDDETLEVLEQTAKVKNITIAEAESDPLFKLHLQSVEQQKKSRNAQLASERASAAKEADKRTFRQVQYDEMVKRGLTPTFSRD